jgi:dTDP-glucose 4,6-dehydratase
VITDGRAILVTGGAGFIGSNFINKIASNQKKYNFVVLDALTYAGRYEYIESVVEKNDNISFFKGDIRDKKLVSDLFNKFNFCGVINFAAESHVDNSIRNPTIFVETNVLGTLNLLNEALKKPNCRFLQVGTDEVYGSLSETSLSSVETDPLLPNSPYSASKASADLLIRSYYETYGMDVIITRCSNNFGPCQYNEKLIPLVINRIKNNEKIPIYGNGQNIRDWIFVVDHVEGIWRAFENGRSGEIYNFGGGNEKRNIDIVEFLLKELGGDKNLIEYVKDRLGHDYRYSIDSRKSKVELNWSPKFSFKEGIIETLNWYEMDSL